MLIPVTQAQSFGRYRRILVNADEIKKVIFANRNHTEPCADLYMKDGSVIKTVEYYSNLKKSGVAI